MNEENQVSEAETEKINPLNEETNENGKKKISSEMVMILLIGFLFGVAIKTEFSKRINVADRTFYGKQGYNFIELQKKLDEQNQNSESNQ